MAELIDKWEVVNKLIELENWCQQNKPFDGFRHAHLYQKICQLEIAIGKTEGLRWIPVAERLPDLTEDRWADEDGSTGSFEISDWVWGITAENTQVRVRYETGPVFQGWYEEDGKTWEITHWMSLPPAPEDRNGH